MEQEQLEKTAKALVAEGKGILAADETVPTLTKRFATLKIESTEDSRRTYREMFFTTPDSCRVYQRRDPAGRNNPAEERRGHIVGGGVVQARNHSGDQSRYRRKGSCRFTGRKNDRRTRWAAGPSERICGDGRAIRQVAGRDSYQRHAAQPDVYQRQRPRIGPVCRPVPGTRHRADRGAGGADGWVSYHRTLRGGHQFSAPYGLPCALRAVRHGWKGCSSNRTW